MNDVDDKQGGISRRRFFAVTGGLVVAANTLKFTGATAGDATTLSRTHETSSTEVTEPFWGPHQGGILTPQQVHTYFAVFDLNTNNIADVIELLRTWTEAAGRMSRGNTARALTNKSDEPPADSGEAIGLSAARLTVTFGFGPGLFMRDGVDRYGLAARRPAALVDLPRFNGDQLIPEKTGGDLSVQACADDPQVAFHAVRQLANLAYGVAKLKWVQIGFSREPISGGTPRNLMGFKDGTNNPSVHRDDLMNKMIWVGDEGPIWMQGGSYLVVRRIRIALEHWDRMELGFQEQVVGRRKDSGAPIGKENEFDSPDLDAMDKDGNPKIPSNAHIRLASATNNNGVQILRRGYSYNDGANFYAERWPPWRQAVEFDAGLLFMAYQVDPRTGFIRINKTLTGGDMMNQFTTHTGSGIFACPPGITEGSYIGAKLFEGLKT